VRIVLVYPPPWKIAPPGAPPYPAAEGPPEGYRQGDLDADFYQTPYGLFSIGAQAMRAGHEVKVLNLSAHAWPDVERVVRDLDAPLWGMSCWTANRRGVRMVAELVKEAHSDAHVVVGGPHATPLPREVLQYFGAVDTVCVGESDRTFLDIVDRVARQEPVRGVAGTFYRDGACVVEGPKRESIEDLDQLASVQTYFDTHILMTSRGCPWNCTFCGAETSWGRGFRANSVDYVVDAMDRVLARLPVKMIQIKDDTFTTHKPRVLSLCRKIRERKLDFFWSCDTRVDLLGDELLREMRLAGCARLSLGVESGSQRILDAIDKKITVAEILESTELAKKYGIKVRYFMMLGNRGETRETFEETLRFLERARPHEYIFSCLSIYPGTRDFEDAEARAGQENGWLDRNAYFTESFQELKTPFDASEADTAYMNAWFRDHSGLRTIEKESAADYARILERLGDYHAAHMDLGAAYYHEGVLDLAERHVRRALELGYPLPGLAYNHLACIAHARGDLDGMMDLFMTAAKTDPQHYVLIQNVNRARGWFKEGGPVKNLPLSLEVRHDFQLLERTTQPTLPGPLPEGFERWSAPARAEPAESFVKTPDLEGSRKDLGARRRLRVV
jgi:anaerobic magnesium-protoporphyrin IX monomethyl ester cyclase